MAWKVRLCDGGAKVNPELRRRAEYFISLDEGLLSFWKCRMSKRSRKRRRVPREGICAYCGNYGELTLDHVVPRCLFTERRNSYLIIDACRPCNERKSQSESHLRDFLALNYSTYDHPNHEKLMSATERSPQWNRSPAVRIARWTARPITITDRGRMIDPIVAPNDGEPIAEAIGYIGRGIFLRVFDAPPERTSEVFSRYMGPLGDHGAVPLLDALGEQPHGGLSENEDVLPRIPLGLQPRYAVPTGVVRLFDPPRRISLHRL